MTVIKTIFMLIIIWHGLMLGSCLVMCENNTEKIFSFVKAVIQHDVKFLTANCKYKTARIICTILWVGAFLLGYIIVWLIKK